MTTEVFDRPTDMLLRQLQANRMAARFKHPETNRRHFSHDKTYRQFFVLEMLAMRQALRERGEIRYAHMEYRPL